MSDLPPGFVLDKPRPQATGADLPPGFVLDKTQSVAPQKGLGTRVGEFVSPSSGGFLDLSKLTGVPAAAETSAKMAQETAYKPGDRIFPPHLDARDPLLYAFGTGNIGMRAPRLPSDQAALAAKGVQMTPGQNMGGLLKGFEDMMQSFPILGHFITNARDRTFKSFNEATINQALEPIGAALPKTSQIGNEAVRHAGNIASTAYDAVLKRIPAVVHDPQLKADVDATIAEASKNPDVWRKLQPIIRHDINEPFGNAGRLEGRDLQNITSELGRQARGYRRSQEFDQRELGRHLDDLKGALDDAIERQYPREAPDLQAVRRTWAMLTRVEQAAGQRRTSGGVFTPNDLLQASAAQASGVRRGGVAREFARGDALFQKWAQTAQRVLPSKIPDSGTAGRLLASDLVGGGAALATGQLSPPLALGALGATGLSTIPYLAPVSRGIQSYMGRTPSGRALPTRAGVAATEESDARKRAKRDLRPSVTGP